LIQPRPTLLPDLKKIIQLACGSNHVLALASTGAVYAWGSGQQNQLGRRIVERNKTNGLTPTQFGLKGKKITTIGCGSYHSFAIDANGKVYAWGLNSYGETGISKEIGDGTESDVHHPAIVPELSSGKHGTVTHIEGGAHHSICVTSSGECLVWGRMDGFQSGMATSSIPTDNLIYDSASKPRILSTPTVLPAIKDASHCAAGSDHCLAVSSSGRVYSWGFNATYQCGQGNDDDVEEATQIDNTAVRGKKIVFAGAGGQFSVIAGLADAETEDTTMVNGVH
jgi:regulator of chromosome condensation